MIEVWLLYAVGSAILWGVAYPISEHLVKNGISPASLMFIYTLFSMPVYGLIAYKWGGLHDSFKSIMGSQTLPLWLVIMIASYMTANLMVFISIEEKNATLASFIEATYPLFTAVFAYLIFQSIQINLATLLGGFLIIIGATIVYNFS